MIEFNNTIGSYWSWSSMIFFIILSLIAVYVFYQEKKHESNLHDVPYKNKSLWFLGLLLLVVAVFRVVNNYTGGADARTYITFFKYCNTTTWQQWDWLLHQDVAFRYFTKLIRLFSNDYHIYFFFVYGIMIASFLYFLKELLPKKVNVIPIVLLIFLYWRGFSTIRSNCAIALMCLALVLLYKGHLKWALAAGVLSCLTHKMAIPYFLFIPFYILFKNYKLKLWHIVIFTTVVYLVSRNAQQYFITAFAEQDLNGSYVSYASKSITGSFFDNYWKIAFEQLFLAACMLLYGTTLRKKILCMDKADAGRVRFIFNVVVFDIICIPLSYIMGIWRAAEFFYLARVVMWCVVIAIAGKPFEGRLKPFYNTVCLLGFLAWMTFRFYSTWEDSDLMPYYFEPFL